MTPPEGLHMERTEFLGLDQSAHGQQLMLQYLDDTESVGELPLYYGDTYERALESGCARRSAPTPRGNSMSTPSFTRRDVSIPSGRIPARAGSTFPPGCGPPVVILGHGLGATREMRLDAFRRTLRRSRHRGTGLHLPPFRGQHGRTPAAPVDHPVNSPTGMPSSPM